MTKFILNGKLVHTNAVATARLLDVLREDFSLLGSKEGCGEGECGACSVLVDEVLQNSCLIPVASLEGSSVMTIEGLQTTEQYKILEQCYAEAGAVQCGFCIPGMVIASYALLRANPQPTEAEVRIGLSGNLCRCTGYNMIVDAVLLAAERGRGRW